MRIKFSTEGAEIQGVPYNSKFQQVMDKVFDGFILDMPQCPNEKQRVELAKDGISIQGNVQYVVITYYAPDNGIYIPELDGVIEYFVRLENMELYDYDKTRYSEELFEESRFSPNDLDDDEA